MKKTRNEAKGPKKRRWMWALAGLFLLVGLWHLVTSQYPEEEKALRLKLRETVKNTFPEEAAEFSRNMGLVYFDADREAPGEAEGGRQSVVLVHGLDDPGKVWNALAPRLAREGLDVWLMNYPNDQPVAESAQLFFDEIKTLRQLGIQRVSIVAHSMGGLVSREMLTSPDIGYGPSQGRGEVPEVVMLIMVATPNHGSQLARFRWFAEIRDHLALLTKGKASWLGGIFDGAGEAKIDLLPGSRFLTALNARSHPRGVEMLTIAGITSPFNDSDIEKWIGSLRRKVPPDQREQVDALEGYLISMTHGLGDGLVTVESTRLEGVPHRTVDGTHLSMIRNISRQSLRVPPSVPIIADRLKALAKPSVD